jgi:invasion protein IalB
MFLRVICSVVLAALTYGAATIVSGETGLGGLSKGQALAQTPPPRPPAGPATPARRPEKGKIFGDWGIECEVQTDRSELCFVQQTHTRTETNQRILSVAVGYIGERGAPAMVAYAPLGIDVASGVAIKTEPGPQIQMRVQTCTPDGCRAFTPLTEQQLAALRAARQMTFGIIPWGQTQTTSIALSVNGFAAAFATLR